MINVYSLLKPYLEKTYLLIILQNIYCINYYKNLIIIKLPYYKSIHSFSMKLIVTCMTI